MEVDSVKRSASVKVPKAVSVAPVEGTSVTPRQRPKGQITSGTITVSGQIVSQISGQGNQIQVQSMSGNNAGQYHQNQQLTPVNPPQSYSLQPGQSVTPSSSQQTLQLSVQSPFVPVSTHMPSPNQNTTFSQSQSPMISQSPLTQQSPVGFENRPPYGEGHLEALFLSSSRFYVDVFRSYLELVV